MFLEYRSYSKMMKITIYGAGYVGLVTATCLAEIGHQVMCVDIDTFKITALNNKQCTIYEFGLEALLQRNIQNGRLRFTAHPEEGVEFGFYQMIAVPTPPNSDGTANLNYVLEVAQTIGQLRREPCVVITKSTVPVGTAQQVKAKLKQELMQAHRTINIDVVSNPEFLREGCAVKDFMYPDRIVIGVENSVAEQHMRALYQPLTLQPEQLVFMDIPSAELTKYAANAMLATKISFINEIAQIAEATGADIAAIHHGIGLDHRIGSHFLNAGCGYGGSCFPKDVSALIATAQQLQLPATLLNAVKHVNDHHKQILFHKIAHYFNYDLTNKTIALWGLAFKPNTDDMREAPSISLINALVDAGASVQAYDPVAHTTAQKLFAQTPRVKLMASKAQALANADALTVVTEWDEFKSPDFVSIKNQLTYPAIFDGRNIYNPQELAALGFDYFAIGRGKNERKTETYKS